jgi:hypothetical protein
MFGHTHIDEFRVVKSYTNPQKAIGAIQICGSITTLNNLQPSYCVYEIDLETWLPVQRNGTGFDLTNANTKGQIDWNINFSWT